MKYPKVFLLSEVFGTDKAFLVDFVLSTTSALGLSIMIKGISGLFNSGLSIYLWLDIIIIHYGSLCRSYG